MNKKTGILLVNIGSPDSPAPRDVRRYLKKFLSDKRVIEIPRLIWLPILYGFILPFRSKSSAKLYQKIWTEQGAPLTVYSKELAAKLKNKTHLPVEIGMHYGNPTLADALDNLRKNHVDKIIILPLYPQYSASTTASVFDTITTYLKNWRVIPELHFIKDYADHPDYIAAIADSIQTEWDKTYKPEHLLFSFHGLPKRFGLLGDPYESRCKLTASLIAAKLCLPSDTWSISFQSRLGRAEWLSPYTDKVLEHLPAQGKKIIDVICPGFAVDCLETLEEIAIRGREQFEAAGGEKLRYLPALNASDAHVTLLEKILNQ